ncbi:MAG: hypothetical protein CVV49_02215 [Spirochaetae bacterium HGW-Spirochaetae-5]|nr:MAG: hypothetical protein CVV49_02215 [Spirochaetae bacterium HGW-Spirochaetae-5]
MQKKYLKIIIPLLLISLLSGSNLATQPVQLPPHIAADIKAERIKFSNDSIKLTWKMNSEYPGDFIVGKSEKEILTIEDALQAKLAGIFNSGMNGILIDREIQQGKKYYYIILAKDYLVKRDIEIIKDVNYTSEPVSLFIEPENVKALKASVSGGDRILIQWSKSNISGIRYNLYRSRSPISSPPELEVAEKILITDKTEFTDTNIPDYGSYFYAVTITDKNGIEYFNPKIDQNFTSTGIYLKGKTLATPLNVGAFSGEKNTIIVKWEKAESRTGKDLQGYEIYRSDEQINSLLKLKFSKLIKIVDSNTTLYTDNDLNPGKYYYAVFSRYSDGAVDINFDTDSNYTKSPLMITLPYKINSLNHETGDNTITIRWNYTGNTGNEIVSIFKTVNPPADSGGIMNDDIIGTENIKSGKYVISPPPSGTFFYGVLSKQENEIIEISKGINLTTGPIKSLNNIISEKPVIIEIKKPEKEKDIKPSATGLDIIIQKTYYKGNYSQALKELKKFTGTTDNKHDLAKARLFIAKSYIEMHEYEKSIKLLESDEVKNTFPEEAKFWFEFALVRLK